MKRRSVQTNGDKRPMKKKAAAKVEPRTTPRAKELADDLHIESNDPNVMEAAKHVVRKHNKIKKRAAEAILNLTDEASTQVGFEWERILHTQVKRFSITCRRLVTTVKQAPAFCKRALSKAVQDFGEQDWILYANHLKSKISSITQSKVATTCLSYLVSAIDSGKYSDQRVIDLENCCTQAFISGVLEGKNDSGARNVKTTLVWLSSQRKLPGTLQAVMQIFELYREDSGALRSAVAAIANNEPPNTLLHLVFNNAVLQAFVVAQELSDQMDLLLGFTYNAIGAVQCGLSGDRMRGMLLDASQGETFVKFLCRMLELAGIDPEKDIHRMVTEPKIKVDLENVAMYMGVSEKHGVFQGLSHIVDVQVKPAAWMSEAFSDAIKDIVGCNAKTVVMKFCEKSAQYEVDAFFDSFDRLAVAFETDQDVQGAITSADRIISRVAQHEQIEVHGELARFGRIILGEAKIRAGMVPRVLAYDAAPALALKEAIVNPPEVDPPRPATVLSDYEASKKALLKLSEAFVKWEGKDEAELIGTHCQMGDAAAAQAVIDSMSGLYHGLWPTFQQELARKISGVQQQQQNGVVHQQQNYVALAPVMAIPAYLDGIPIAHAPAAAAPAVPVAAPVLDLNDDDDDADDDAADVDEEEEEEDEEAQEEGVEENEDDEEVGEE